jgi:DNA-binding NtrC family response regulator
LDEINSAGPEVQVRLLQFIQDCTLLRVGGVMPLRVNTRLVLATNEDLLPLVSAGRFRKDLYYRINVFPITLPPLRERCEDIAPFAEQFLVRFARELERPARMFSPAALEQLQAYSWPGNIRELENLIQRAVILCRGDRIEAGHLPIQPAAASAEPDCGAPFPPDASLEEVERLWIARTLACCQGNKSEAARRLGIDVSTLHRRLRAHLARDPSDDVPGAR